MSLFGSILNKLGFGKKDETPSSPASKPAESGGPAAPASSGPVAAPSQPGGGTPASQPAPTTQAGPVATPQQPKAAISQVDVVSQLEGLASSNGQKLNWRESIVDLLKLLSLDSSLDSRKALAQELGCPADKMADSAKMNIWLHKTVLQKLADNGGNIPKELL